MPLRFDVLMSVSPSGRNAATIRVDEMIRIDIQELCAAIGNMFEHAGVILEPAGAKAC